ncbi:Hpt domain-containing protein [Nocardioides sp. 503]|uniref:Hpt domain-containing protein n=1 Tax=Nocardioides sp. 503 TaxID=2508326 RepID=UPI0010700397|nr:Hpt domain-containing protein [Nocardioides sp. 503]
MSALDRTCLERLAHDVASHPFMVTFAEKYRLLLPQRIRRVLAALAEGDLEAALDAALSLRVASAYVGALELVEIARHLESHLRTGDLTGAVVRAGTMDAAAHRTELALSTYLAELALAA